MKKLLLISLSIILAVSFAACAGKKSSKNNKADISTSSVSENSASKKSSDNSQIPNPWTDCDNLASAVSVAGFSFEAPKSLPDNFENPVYSAMSGEMIQIIYTDKNNNEITLRKGIGSKDVSGDYNKYSDSKKVTLNNADVTFKGDGKSVNEAIWTSDGYSYSVFVNINGSGISESEITQIIKSVK